MLSSDYETKVRINKKELLDCIDRATSCNQRGEKKPIIINIRGRINEPADQVPALGSMNEEILITKQGKGSDDRIQPEILK